MRLGLILSNDWEVFGDGSGDYRVVQHTPLVECLDVVNDHGAYMSVMAEVGQQIWGFRQLGESEKWAADIADEWEDIVRETVRRGSDVQLHLHPQWIGAKRVDDDWVLDYDKWAIGGLEPEEIVEALSRGKRYLEDLIQPIAPSYQCHTFRAGAYCIEPSKSVIAALRSLGFRSDTSVTKGMFDVQFYDYRSAPSVTRPWLIGDSVLQQAAESDDQLLEFPIFSFRLVDSLGLRAILGGARSRDFMYRVGLGVPYLEEDRRWFAERDRIRSIRYPASRRPMQQTKTHKIKGLLSSIGGVLSIAAWPTTVQLDYDYLPPNVFARALERFLEKAEKSWRDDADVILPIMASGHVKNMHNAENLDRILTETRRVLGDSLVHWTTTDAVDYWSDKEHTSNLVQHA